MARYVFLCLPAYGHLNPTLAVARELVARGEEVIYYLPEQFRAATQGTGAAFRGYETGLDLGKLPASDDFQRAGSFFPRMILEESRRVLPQMLERVRAEQPDCVVYDFMCLWARVLTEKLHLPAAAFRPTYAMNRRVNPFAGRRGAGMAEAKAMREALERMGEGLEQLCRDYGVQALEPREIFTHAEALNLVFVLRAFQPRSETFDGRFLFVGPSILPRPAAGDFPLDRLTDRPLLYIALGTIFNDRPDFYRACFAAFGDLPWQVVLARGDRVDPEALGPAPHNFLISSHAPQLELLARARVFVTHGGMNSAMESLYHGAPMVVIPQMPEQAMTARRVEELGLGLALSPETLSAEALREAVRRVDEDAALRERVLRMQRLAREAGGYLEAADALVRFVQTRPSAQPRAA